MSSVKDKDYECLICTCVIPPDKIKQVDKFESLFLLRILLEITEEEELVKNISNELSLIQICDGCADNIKQCKKIYDEICLKIERFWECQNKILEKFSADSSSNETSKDNWFFKCRQFVKDHDFTGFGYPFTVYDLESLLISIPALPHQLPDGITCAAKNDFAANVPENDDMSKYAFVEIPSSFSQPSEQDINSTVKQEPESSEDEAADVQDDYDDNVDLSDNDSDYEPSSSKKPKITKPKRSSATKSTKQVNRQDNQSKKGCYRKLSKFYPNFKRDPTTQKFHCTWSATECSQQFKVEECMRSHWDKHQGTPHQTCEECPQAFYSRRELVGHTQKEHPKNDDKFDCEKCGKNYKTREALLSHLRNHHNEKKDEKRRLKLKKKEEDPIKRDPASNKWRCWWPECGKLYLERTDLNFHIDRHKGTPSQKCGECGALFYSRGQLIDHKEREHEKDKKFGCGICGEEFDTSSELYKHKTFKHSESGRGVEVVCEICGKSFKKVCLYSHMRFVHGADEERKFCCHLCPAVFMNTTGLKRHLWGRHGYCEDEKDKERFERQREQVKVKGYKWTCHVKGCRVRYVTEEGLKKHVDGVHKGGKGEEWKFKCEFCGKGFHVRQKWARHVKQHEK